MSRNVVVETRDRITRIELDRADKKNAITSDQVRLLKKDNVVSKEAETEGRTLKGIGVTPTLVNSVIGSYLVQYRPHGQYTGSGKAA